MIKTLPHFLLYVTVIALAVGCNPNDSSGEKHISPLVGEWLLINQKAQGAGVRLTWTFDGQAIVIASGIGEVFSESPYTIDTSKNPSHITMSIGGLVAEERPGIFKIVDGDLHLSFSVDGSPRPASWDEGDPMILARVQSP